MYNFNNIINFGMNNDDHGINNKITKICQYNFEGNGETH